MNISITGTADKRPIVYPLLYVLNILGSTLFLTNDTDYRRLMAGTEKGEIGNIYLNASARMNDGIINRYEKMSKDFEHCVIVSFEETGLFENKINVIRDGEETEKGVYIRVGYSVPKAEAAPRKKEFFIPQNDSLFRQLYQIELSSRFTPIKDTQALKALSSVFAPMFGKTEKEMRKLLLYKGGRIT